jgi:NAD(P)-dependent dehydrogenase (short-subunit alcohol dehydrogenase family)
LITGGGAGIGAGIARRFAEEGAAVVVAERDERTGRDVAETIGGLFVPVDVTVREQVEDAVAQAVSTYGSIDIVVNNAWGGGSIGRVENKTDQQLSDGIAVAYYGPFWAMRAALPHMRERGWGRVINVCSLNGVNAHMGTLEYNAAKEALRTLTRTAAREWAPFGVTVNAICPAAKSPAFMRALGDNPDIAALADAANPMGRIGDPYLDIAPVALFLAGDGCRYLSATPCSSTAGATSTGWPGHPISTRRSNRLPAAIAPLGLLEVAPAAYQPRSRHWVCWGSLPRPTSRDRATLPSWGAQRPASCRHRDRDRRRWSHRRRRTLG